MAGCFGIRSLRGTAGAGLALCACAWLLVGCPAPLAITSDTAPGADLSQLRSYAWGSVQMLPAGGWEPEELDRLRQGVHASVLAMLADRGYRELPRGEADAVLGYRLVVRRLEEAAGPSREERSQELAERGGGATIPRPAEQRPAGFSGEAVLTLELSDPVNGRVLWQGVAEYELSSIGQSLRQSRQAVRRLGARLPDCADCP